MFTQLFAGQATKWITFATPFQKRAATVVVGAVTAVALVIFAYGTLSLAGLGSPLFRVSGAMFPIGLIYSVIGSIFTVKCFRAPIITHPNPPPNQSLPQGDGLISTLPTRPRRV